MRRSFSLSIVALALLASLAAAEPEVVVGYRAGVPVIQLTGSYRGGTYTVYRASAPDPVFQAITDGDVLCTGDCLAIDYDARAGQTYLYRFDVTLQGRFTSYGPFAVTIPRDEARPLAATIQPNPSRGSARVTISLAGRPGDAPVAVEATVHDLAGRAVRVLHRGQLPRGSTTLEWDGRDDSGRPLGSGLYFLRVRSGTGFFTTPIVRTR
jgi:hypothetical protein